MIFRLIFEELSAELKIKEIKEINKKEINYSISFSYNYYRMKSFCKMIPLFFCVRIKFQGD